MGLRRLVSRPFRAVERVFRRATRGITRVFSRREEGGGYTEEILEQVQKIEVVLKDPSPDEDKLKLKELTNSIILFDIKEDIPKNFSTADLIEHFDMTEIEGRWE